MKFYEAHTFINDKKKNCKKKVVLSIAPPSAKSYFSANGWCFHSRSQLAINTYKKTMDLKMAQSDVLVFAS